jgi:hypothetical protein
LALISSFHPSSRGMTRGLFPDMAAQTVRTGKRVLGWVAAFRGITLVARKGK